MEGEVRILVKEIRNGFQSAETSEEIVKWLSVVRAILIPQILQNQDNPSLSEISKLTYSISDLKGMQPLVLQCHAKQIYEILISKLSLEWITTLSTDKFDKLVKPVFFEGPVKDSFYTLFLTVIESVRKDFSFHKCTSLLEEFLTRERLFQLLQHLSSSHKIDNSPASLDKETELLILSLTSLPEKLANRLQRENSDKFLPQNYIPLLAFSILDTLQWAHSLLNKGQNVSLLAVSVLIGKLCITGHADLLLNTLLPHLSIRVRSDFIWCRICERVFVGVPARCLEAVVIPLLRKISWYGLVDKFLGDCVVHSAAIKILLCTKLLLHRHYSKPKLLLQNIIGYLSTFHTRRHLLMEVTLSLLQVWGDSSSMRHISAEQHLYITQALMICVGVMNETEKKNHKDELLRMLMPGVQAHLESSDPTVRMVGMTLAKMLTQTVDPSGPQLEFEVDQTNPVIADLLTYKDLPPDPGPTEAERDIAAASSDKKTDTDDIAAKTKQMTLEENRQKLQVQADSDLDSDDDLEPFDMSNDRKVSKAKPPKYVRDCMEGLICSSDDPDRTEVCLQHAEALIRKKTDGLEEIAAEFAKILLHLQDTHSFENFLVNRFSSLVALTVTCPAQVSEYLTIQFYERNYSIRQRLDILETLASAAHELSQPLKAKAEEKKPGPIISELSPNSEPASWREIVQRRIESNTRRFSKGRTRPEPVPTLSRFAPVAGQFFYPLMTKVDRSEPFLDLLGKDGVLLFRLLYTLAIVLLAAMNVPTAAQMGRALLEFTWPLRMHQDSSVRQAVLIATSSIFLVVPAYSLMTDLHADVTETRSWLEEVVEQDADSECQKLAAQALLLLQDQIKKEVESSKS